jgi:hypothetical protein
LVFLLAILLFYPFRFVFEFDRDEGINAIKSLLVLRGFRLYADIWNDQPPIFTLLLALWFQLFGLRVVAGRFLVLLFSTALIGAVAFYLRRTWGVAAAVVSVLLLALLPLYLELSVSIMIGLPAIALAVMSFVCQTLWHEKRSFIWLVLSSGLLALSVLTKGFTAILIPLWVIAMALAIRRGEPHGRDTIRSWTSIVVWVLVFLAICALVAVLMVGIGNVDQLFEVHLAAESSAAFQASDLLPGINVLLGKSLPVLLLAMVGAVQAYRKKQWIAMYLVGWLGAAYALLLVHRPTWPHQQLLVTVPAAVLAAAAVGSAIDAIREGWPVRSGHRFPKPWSMAIVAVTVWFLVVQGPATLRQFRGGWPNLRADPSANVQERQIVAILSDHASGTSWLFTDRPMFAFLADLPVPPNLAVLSRKRLETGELTSAELLSMLEEYKPELILKGGRFDLQAVDEYMQRRDYRRLDDTGRYRLFERQGTP